MMFVRIELNTNRTYHAPHDVRAAGDDVDDGDDGWHAENCHRYSC